MHTDTRREQYLPFPELVERRSGSTRAPYGIIDSREGSASEMAGAVDKVARRMSVPLDEYGRGVGRHELGHVIWSPLSPVKVAFDPRVLAAVEDARVNLALEAAGLPVDLDDVGDLRVEWLLAFDAKHGDAFAIFVRSVASVGTSVEPLLLAQLGRLADPGAEFALAATHRVRAVLERARVRAGGEVAPERRGRALARDFAFRLRALGLLDETGVSRSALVMDCCIAHVHAPEPAKDGKGSASGKREDVPDVEPGRMPIARARLTRKLNGRNGLRAWRSATEGSVIRHAHRWPIDRAIFRKRGARSRGTVLVDVSSSMSLADEDLERLLAGAGEGTRVAIYSGAGSEGELRIVADAGRRAEGDELSRYGGGNIIDVPALRWLTRQPSPRLWISDGRVTGIGDRGSQRIRDLCRTLCRRSAIRRVEDIDAAARLLGVKQR